MIIKCPKCDKILMKLYYDYFNSSYDAKSSNRLLELTEDTILKCYKKHQLKNYKNKFNYV